VCGCHVIMTRSASSLGAYTGAWRILGRTEAGELEPDGNYLDGREDRVQLQPNDVSMDGRPMRTPRGHNPGV
jgi:hypothetical protein